MNLVCEVRQSLDLGADIVADSLVETHTAAAAGRIPVEVRNPVVDCRSPVEGSVNRSLGLGCRRSRKVQTS